jgi:copper transport protein
MDFLRRAFAIGILLAGLSGATIESSLSAVPDDSFFTHLHTERAMANVTVSPARVGPVELSIQLETVEELPLTAKAVSVTLTDMQTGRALRTIDAARRGDNQWHAAVSMPSAGNWMLALVIAISDSDKVDVAAPIIIK